MDLSQHQVSQPKFIIALLCCILYARKFVVLHLSVVYCCVLAITAMGCTAAGLLRRSRRTRLRSSGYSNRLSA